MVREEKVISIIRFYNEDTDDPYAKYVAACTLLWESETTVWVKALSGTLNRKVLREFIQTLISKGVTLVKSTRAGASLPYATKIDGNYCEIDLTKRHIEIARLARE